MVEYSIPVLRLTLKHQQVERSREDRMAFYEAIRALNLDVPKGATIDYIYDKLGQVSSEQAA